MPIKNKFSVFSNVRGKVNIVPNPIVMGERIWPGMMISYFCSGGLKTYFAQGIEILMTPVDNSGAEISWIHSLLEIVYYFLPLESPSIEVFNLLHRAFSFLAFSDYFEENFILLKKLFIVKILQSLGFYSEFDESYCFAQFEKLVFGSVDFPNSRAVESLKIIFDAVAQEEKNRIDKWIDMCITRHPYAQTFRALTFFNN